MLLVAVSLHAQQERATSLYVFVSNPEYGWSGGGGTHADASFGVALQRKFTERFSMELGASRSSGSTGFTVVDANGNFEHHRRSWTVTPIDFAAHFHIRNSVTWKPYIGAAVRWTNAPSDPGANDSTTIGPSAGVVWQFRPNLGLRLDGKVLLGDNMDYTNVINLSAGLAWRF